MARLLKSTRAFSCLSGVCKWDGLCHCVCVRACVCMYVCVCVCVSTNRQVDGHVIAERVWNIERAREIGWKGRSVREEQIEGGRLEGWRTRLLHTNGHRRPFECSGDCKPLPLSISLALSGSSALIPSVSFHLSRSFCPYPFHLFLYLSLLLAISLLYLSLSVWLACILALLALLCHASDVWVRSLGCVYNEDIETEQ